MKRMLVTILLLTGLSAGTFGQRSAPADISALAAGEPAYPVLFLHGLAGSDTTWTAAINHFQTAWGYYSSEQIFHAVLNAQTATLYTADVMTTFNNEDNALPAGTMYAMNFNNFWNTNPLDPQIVNYSMAAPGLGESPGNASAIVKQGYALKQMIQAVLAATGAEKVILIGHSMGGLEAREYLQRRDGSGDPMWWIDPGSPDGHKVAKLVTVGTPHLGSNYMASITGVANFEAIRDLRYDFTSDRFAPDPTKDVAPYLFGGSETAAELMTFNNADINCDGDETDTDIEGLNSPDTSGFDNPDMPLPSNVEYTWVISYTDDNPSFQEDGFVRTDRMWLYDQGDTILTHTEHKAEPRDFRAVTRGLDEPDVPEFAYGVAPERSYAGFITRQPNYAATDDDCFAFENAYFEKLRVIVDESSLGCGVTSIEISDDGGSLGSKTVADFPDTLLVDVTPGETIYATVTGAATDNSWEIPYTLFLEDGNIIANIWQAATSGILDFSDSDFETAVDLDVHSTSAPKPAAAASPDVFLKITTRLLDNAPANHGETDNVSLYRWVITEERDGAFAIDSIMINVAQIAEAGIADVGVTDASAVSIMRRETPGSGAFTTLPTTLRGDTLIAYPGGFGEFALVSATNPLPVELLSFEAVTSDEAIELTWRVAQEANVAAYEVERKSDGAFATVGTVKATGASLYAFADDAAKTDVRYVYRVKAIDRDGAFVYSDRVEATLEAPIDYALRQNYPNPFNPVTQIEFSTPAPGRASLVVFNAIGEVVAKLLEGEIEAGTHAVSFDASDLPSGIYFYRLTAGSFTQVKKMTLLR
ncbi:MAG: alpha/beta fold hydrolase [Ignavibacteriales bacterium]|nr:alpha/beta fold hydrolase [Ignavibacteriales bacterium]